MAEKRIRIGLVGATPGVGWGPRAHVPAYRALPEVELAAVCTAHRETAEASAKAFGVGKAYHDYRALAADPEIDVVSVVTKVPLHAEIVRAALEAGKAVYCEWPLARTTEEADDLLQRAEAAGRPTAVGLQARVVPVLMHLKQLLAEGFVGEVRNVTTTLFLAGAFRPRAERSRHMADRATNMDVLSIYAGHSLDVLRWAVGDFERVKGEVATLVPETTLAETGERIPVSAVDGVGLVGRLANGALATAHISTAVTANAGWQLAVFGTQGWLIARANGMPQTAPIVLRGARGDGPEEEITAPPERNWTPEIPPDQPAFAIAQLFRAFARTLAGAPPAYATFADARALHAFLDRLQGDP